MEGETDPSVESQHNEGGKKEKSVSTVHFDFEGRTDNAITLNLNSLDTKSTFDLSNTNCQQSTSFFMVRSFKCLTCSALFHSAEDIKSHVKTHKKGRPSRQSQKAVELVRNDDSYLKSMKKPIGRVDSATLTSMHGANDACKLGDSILNLPLAIRKPVMLSRRSDRSNHKPVPYNDKIQSQPFLPKPFIPTVIRDINPASYDVASNEPNCHTTNDTDPLDGEAILPKDRMSETDGAEMCRKLQETHQESAKESPVSVLETITDMTYDDTNTNPGTAAESASLRNSSSKQSREDALTTELDDSMLPMPCCRCGICNASFSSRKEVSKHIKIKHYRWSSNESMQENHGEDDQECPISDLIELPSASGKASFFLPDFNDIDTFLRLSPSAALADKDDQVLTSKTVNDEHPTSRTCDVTHLGTVGTYLTSNPDDCAHGPRCNSVDDVYTGIATINAHTIANDGYVSSGGTWEKDGCGSDIRMDSNTSTSSAISCRRDDKGRSQNNLQYLCELCELNFASFGTCSLHMRTKHKKTPILPAALQDSNVKQIEQSFSSAILPKVSDTCSRNGPKRIFICSLCGDQFLSLRYCSKHIKEEHLPQCSSETDARETEKDEQINESTWNGLGKVHLVKREEHDREITIDLLLKLTQIILARYKSDEQTDDDDGSETDGQVTGDSIVEDSATGCLRDLKCAAEEDFEAIDHVDDSVSSEVNPEDALHNNDELSTEPTALMYHCFFCPERFPSFRDCGRHMINKLGPHQITLDQLKKMYQVNEHLEEPTDKGLLGERTLIESATKSEERRHKSTSSNEEKASEQLHGPTEDGTGDGELRRQRLHDDIGTVVDDGAASLEEPSPKKMKHNLRNLRSKDVKLGSVKQKVVQKRKRVQKANQGQRRCKNQDQSPKSPMSVGSSKTEERRHKSTSLNEEKASEELHGPTKDGAGDGELRRQRLHDDISTVVDDGAASLEEPSPQKMKHNLRNLRSKDVKLGSVKQNMVQKRKRVQKANQEQRRRKNQDQSHLEKASPFQCSECSEIFKSAFQLDKHISGKHCGVSSLKCQKCAQYASTPAEEKYRSILEEIKAVKEDILSRGFKKKGGAEKIEHYFECVVCGDGFRYRMHFDKHQSCHTEYVCRMCQQDFSSFTALSMHVHSHNCGPLPCEDCGKTFYNTNSWLNHVLQHKKELQCDICHMTIGNLQNLKRHKITKHHVGEKDSFECGECGKTFHFKYKYLLHIQNVHTPYDPENNRNYLCDHCGMKLKSASYLRLHVLTHQDVFTCKQCGCWFKQQSQLDLHQKRAHMNSAFIEPENLTSSQPTDTTQLDTNITERGSVLQQPKGDKPQRKHKRKSRLMHKCGFCNTYFRSVKLKISHEGRHKGVAFQCGKCDALLPSYEDYGNHLRNTHEHPEQLYYKCSVCPKRFQAPWQLERHSRRHCTCEKCGLTFEKMDLLIEHLDTNDDCGDHLSTRKSSKHMTHRHPSQVSNRSKRSNKTSSPTNLAASAALTVAAQENVPSNVSSNVLPLEGIEMMDNLSDEDGATDLLMSLAGCVGN